MSENLSDGSGCMSKPYFEEACQTLARCSDSSSGGRSLETRRAGGQLYLRIVRPLSTNLRPRAQTGSTEPFSTARNSHNFHEPSNSQEDHNGGDHQDDDDDDDLAVYHPTPSQTVSSVEYHILHSTSYRVPVLYFFVHNVPPSTLLSIDTVYENLVPKHLQSEMRSVSVMGGIGITNHPLTDVPCFWVHPCNSPEAIRNVLGGIKGQVSSVEYLMLWIGVVGSAVGLSLPKEMVPKRRKVS